jgi:hypothetical protein
VSVILAYIPVKVVAPLFHVWVIESGVDAVMVPAANVFCPVKLCVPVRSATLEESRASARVPLVRSEAFVVGGDASEKGRSGILTTDK